MENIEKKVNELIALKDRYYTDAKKEAGSSRENLIFDHLRTAAEIDGILYVLDELDIGYDADYEGGSRSSIDMKNFKIEKERICPN